MFIETNSLYRRLGSGEGIKGLEELQLVRTVSVRRNPNTVTFALLKRPGGWETIDRQDFEDKYVLHDETRRKAVAAFKHEHVEMGS